MFFLSTDNLDSLSSQSSEELINSPPVSREILITNRTKTTKINVKCADNILLRNYQQDPGVLQGDDDIVGNASHKEVSGDSAVIAFSFKSCF